MKSYHSEKEVYRDIITLECALEYYYDTIGLFYGKEAANPRCAIINQMICNKKLAKAIKDINCSEIFKGEDISVTEKAERVISFLTAYKENGMKVPEYYVNRSVDRRIRLLNAAVKDYDKLMEESKQSNVVRPSSNAKAIREMICQNKLFKAVKYSRCRDIEKDKRLSTYDKAKACLEVLQEKRLIKTTGVKVETKYSEIEK